ncbi:MAG: J domain-containing protein [Calditrichia bacterium]|nr:J domain-containing protein [Calditrichia bacterium]
MSILKRLGNIIKSHILPSKNSFNGFNKQKTFYQTADIENNDNLDDKDPVIAGYYTNLELPYGAGLKEVTAAWKNSLKKYHPDLHSNNPQKQQTAHQLVQGLNKAYEELKKNLNNK